MITEKDRELMDFMGYRYKMTWVGTAGDRRGSFFMREKEMKEFADMVVRLGGRIIATDSKE